MSKHALYIMCGLPGSGKSTWLKEHISPTMIVSRDEIRFSMLKDTDNYFAKENQVYNTFVKIINDKLQKHDVYADATHLNCSSRMKLINRIFNAAELNLIYFDVDVHTALARNELRKNLSRQYVPPYRIEEMDNNYRFPDNQEKIRYNKIYIVNAKGEIREGTDDIF